MWLDQGELIVVHAFKPHAWLTQPLIELYVSSFKHYPFLHQIADLMLPALCYLLQVLNVTLCDGRAAFSSNASNGLSSFMHCPSIKTLIPKLLAVRVSAQCVLQKICVPLSRSNASTIEGLSSSLPTLTHTLPVHRNSKYPSSKQLASSAQGVIQNCASSSNAFTTFVPTTVSC